MIAMGTAREELKRGRARRRTIVAIEVMVGAIGLTGLTLLVLVGAPQVPPTLAFVFAIAGAVPILGSIRISGFGNPKESEIVAALESARAAALNAASLRDAATLLPTSDTGGPAPQDIFDAMLTNVEQSAAVAPGREKRTRGTPGEQARRHVRIKPLNDRVLVTRSDGVAILTQLVDVSLSGVAVSGTLPDVEVGDQVLVGSRAARVVRALPHGIACEFVKTLPAAQLDVDIVL